jgi:glucose-1-phosphate adenylyltransferase
MGIYIFNWKVLKEALITLKDQPGCDFGMHVIPYVHAKSSNCYAYEFNGYWKDVGTLGSYWEANMELIDIVPEFNLYEEYWKVYTNNDIIKPQYFGEHASVDRCIIGEGAGIYGEVHNSIIGAGVVIEEGAVVRDSIIMQGTKVGAGTQIDKAIIAESVAIGEGCTIGTGEFAPNVYNPKVYAFDLVTVAENSVIPSHVQVGRNTAIVGETVSEDYPDGRLESGQVIIKAGEI